MIKIFTDTGSDLTPETLKNFKLEAVPLYVTFDKNKYYKEQQEIPLREIYDQMIDEGVFPSTSLVTTLDFVNKFTPHLENGDDILYIGLSSKFSGTFQNSLLAKQNLAKKYEASRIEVVDSIQASMGLGLLAIEASKMRDAGYTLKQMVDTLRKIKETARVFFTIDDFKFLKHGGRVGATAALAGTILNIKPVLVMQSGELNPVEKVRGKKKAYSKILELIDNNIGNEKTNYELSVLVGIYEEDAEEIHAELRRKGYSVQLKPQKVGATIAVHAGPQVIGVAYTKKFDKLGGK